MIQFYTMPLSASRRDNLLQALFWINASGSPLDVFVAAQRHMQDGAESIELDRGDWLELQGRVEQWGLQCRDRRSVALNLASLIETALRGEPSRVIEESTKVAGPVERQGDLFGGVFGSEGK